MTLAFQISLTREKAIRVKRPSTSLAINYFLLLTPLACMTLPTPVLADDDRQSETVPEINAYIRLSDRFRLFAVASVTQSLTEGPTDGELGAYLDVLSLKPIFAERLLDIDWARNRYLWARIGYAFAGIHEGLRLSEGYSETRFVAELSGRYPISRGFWMLTRARIDMRTLSGQRSDRYRFRLGLEKEYTVLGRALIPYARAEFLYDTRFDAWNRQIYQVGVEIELTQRFRIEPSYAFQIDTAAPPTHLDRVGIVLTYYR